MKIRTSFVSNSSSMSCYTIAKYDPMKLVECPTCKSKVPLRTFLDKYVKIYHKQLVELCKHPDNMEELPDYISGELASVRERVLEAVKNGYTVALLKEEYDDYTDEGPEWDIIRDNIDKLKSWTRFL